LIGIPQQATVGVPTVLEWLAGDDRIHVHVGSGGEDTFVRNAIAKRCLYLGFGGNDVVSDGKANEAAAGGVSPDSQRDSRFKNDRIVGLDGQTSIPTLTQPSSHLPPSTTAIEEGAN